MRKKSKKQLNDVQKDSDMVLKNSYKFGSNDAVIYSGNKISKKSNIGKISIINSLCIFFALFIIINIINTISVEYNMNKQNNLLKNEMASVKNEKDKLEGQIKFFKSNDGVEKIARDNLGLIKNNEVPVRYIEKK